MDYANDDSGYGNDVLYRMCAEKPSHDNLDVVRSKLIIIGRTYSVSIQRNSRKDFDFDDVAQLMISSPIDAWIDELNKIDKPTEANISKILQSHKFLVDLFAKATDLENRSLASKYLHFHARRAVFIYDSRAKKKIREILKGQKVLVPRLNYDADSKYTVFSYQCLHYRDTLEKKLGMQVSPRLLDLHLLGHENRYHSQALGQ